jgi:hypothetical protein
VSTRAFPSTEEVVKKVRFNGKIILMKWCLRHPTFGVVLVVFLDWGSLFQDLGLLPQDLRWRNGTSMRMDAKGDRKAVKGNLQYQLQAVKKIPKWAPEMQGHFHSVV